MGRLKIDFGIDLGTTNSSISKMENGKSVIKKTDTQKDTLPSCIYINKKKSFQFGDAAYSALRRDKLRAMINWDKSNSNAFIEFKRTMGTDKKYYSSNMNKDFSSEELSAEVLKTLKSFVTDEKISSIVITVPAKFTINQKDATRRAGKLAGFEHVELLQEPIAASMAFGLDSQNKNGFWLVFDFGGGTFDAALLKVEEGIMKVIDTEGDNYLGGKNLDYAIVDEIIIPHIEENNVIDDIMEDDIKREILRDAMKFYAEETKIQMSFNDSHNILSDIGDIPGSDDDGEEFELDIDVTQDMMKEALEPIFQRAIDLSIDLLKRNNLHGDKLDSLILVGGPTYSPVLRNMLEEQIAKPNTNADPMTVVSKGAALYASTINISENVRDQERDSTKIQLELGFEATTVEEEEFVTIKLLKHKTTGNIPEKIFAEFVRDDSAWSSGKTEINSIGEIIEIVLNKSRTNLFNIKLFDGIGNILQSEPNEFTIIQGTKVGSALLPYNIGLAIKEINSGFAELALIDGLEKNKSLPAIGTANGFKTQKDIRPGIKKDFLKIPIYQGELLAKGTRAIYSDHVYDIIISGIDIPEFLPRDSSIDCTLKVDRSEKMQFEAYIPAIDFTYEVNVPTNTTKGEVDSVWLESEIEKAKQIISLLEQENLEDSKNSEIEEIRRRINDLSNRFEQGRTNFDNKQEVLTNLKKEFLKLDKLQKTSKWSKTEIELKEVFYMLEETHKKYGNEKTLNLVEQFRDNIPTILKEKDLRTANELIQQMRDLEFALEDEGLGVKMELGYLKYFDDDFELMDWKDEDEAKRLIAKGYQIATDNPTKEKMRPLILALFKLLPDSQKPISPKGNDSLLVR